MPISQKSTDFLFENYMKNDRGWFQANRHLYKDYVETPLMELAAGVLPTVVKIDPLITADPRRCLSRVWLDMRINRSGMFFRDHMWVSFRRGKGTAYPAFYFEFSPRGYSYGVGYYAMPAAVRQVVCEWVLADDKRFLDAQAALESLPGFYIDGPEYKRKKYPNAPAEKQAWLNRKSLSVIHEGKDAKLLFSNRLAGRLAEVFGQLAPVYAMLLDAHLTVLPEGEAAAQL